MIFLIPFTLPPRHMQYKFNNKNTHTDTKQQKTSFRKRDKSKRHIMLIVSANCHNQNMLDTHINVSTLLL